MIVKNLNIKNANAYLNTIDAEVGDWGQIKAKFDNKEVTKINYPAPENALDLLNFSTHISDWLPKGDWKLL